MSVGNIDVIAMPRDAGIILDVEKNTHDRVRDQVRWLLTREEAQYLADELLGAIEGKETEQQRAWREDTDGRYSGGA